MKKPKIVVIGAGSASFGLANLGAILRTPELKGSELCLIDINEKGLNMITKLAHRVNKEWQADFTIKSSIERRDLLEDADFVIVSIAIDREKCWISDFEIAQTYKIMHYAENGGPGAFMHTARNIAIVMPILKDIEELCPDAWVLNFTNPVPRICIAANRYSNIKTLGICHQINFGYLILANVLAEDYGLKFSQDYLFRWGSDGGEPKAFEYGGRISDKVEILAGGINHFTWIDHATYNGIDLMPIFAEFVEKNYEKGFMPDGDADAWKKDHFSSALRVKYDLFRKYKLIPAAGD